MKELTFNQVEEVSGGIFINPVTVMIGVRLCQMAAPHVGRVLIAVAGGLGASDGEDAAK